MHVDMADNGQKIQAESLNEAELDWTSENCKQEKADVAVMHRRVTGAACIQPSCSNEWKYRGNSAPYGPYGWLSLNSLNMSVRLQLAKPNLHVNLPARRHGHEYGLI